MNKKRFLLITTPAFSLLPMITAISASTLSGQQKKHLKNSIIQHLLANFSDLKIENDVLIYNNKYIVYNENELIDTEFLFNQFIYKLNGVLNSSNVINKELNENNLYFILTYKNTPENKNFSIQVKNYETNSIFEITGNVNFEITQFKYTLKSTKQLLQQSLSPNFSSENLNEEEKQLLKNEMESRLLKSFYKLDNYNLNYVNPVYQKLISEENSVKTYYFDSIFSLDFYSPYENEKIFINDIGIEVKNKHFNFDLRTLNKNKNNEIFRFDEPIKVKLVKYNKFTGQEVLQLEQIWIISSSISDSNYRILNWNPENQYNQFNLITPYLTNLKREPILDEKGNKIENPNYDPLINAKLGTKTELVWINLPKTNFYSKFATLPEFELLENEFNSSNKQIEYYIKNNVPLGIKNVNMSPDLINSNRNDSELNGFLAASILTNSGVEFIIPNDVDLVFIYKVNTNSNELSFIPFDDNKYVQVLRNKGLNINRKFDQFYFSQSGTYLVATAKQNNQTNLTLLTIDQNNKNISNVAQFINKSYVNEFYNTNISTKFLNWVQKEYSLTPDKVRQLDYFNTLNLFNQFVSSNNKSYGVFDPTINFNNSNLIINPPELKSDTFNNVDFKSYVNDFLLSDLETYKNKTKEQIDKLTQEFSIEEDEIKKELIKNKIIAAQTDLNQLNNDSFNYKTIKERLYNNLFSEKSSKKYLDLNSVSIQNIKNFGNNDLYTYHSFNFIFSLKNEYIGSTLTKNYLKAIIKFKNPNFNPNLERTDIDALIDKLKQQLDIPVDPVLVLDSAYIDKLTEQYTFFNFDEQKIKNNINQNWFTNTAEEFKKYTYSITFHKNEFQKTITMLLNVYNDKNIKIQSLLHPIKLTKFNDNDLFYNFNLQKINIAEINEIGLIKNYLINKINNEFLNNTNTLVNKVKYSVDWEFDLNDELLLQKIRSLKNNNIEFDLKIISKNNWLKNYRNIKIINTVEANKTDLSNYNFSINLTENYSLEQLEKVILESISKNIDFVNKLNLSDINYFIRTVYYSQNKNFELLLKPLENFYDEFENKLKISIIKNFTNNENFNINEIFAFDNIYINANNINEIFDELYKFLTDKNNVLHFEIFKDFQLNNLNNLIFIYRKNLLIPIKNKNLIPENSKLSEIKNILKNIEKNLIIKENKNLINQILEKLNFLDKFDKFTENSKNKIINSINNLLFLINLEISEVDNNEINYLKKFIEEKFISLDLIFQNKNKKINLILNGNIENFNLLNLKNEISNFSNSKKENLIEEIEILINNEKNLKENLINIQKENNEEKNYSWIIYFSVIALIIFILILFFYRTQNKLKAKNNFLSKIKNVKSIKNIKNKINSKNNKKSKSNNKTEENKILENKNSEIIEKNNIEQNSDEILIEIEHFTKFKKLFYKLSNSDVKTYNQLEQKLKNNNLEIDGIGKTRIEYLNSLIEKYKNNEKK
uniref:SAP domain-containing protein n=1 Tax=Mycoplasma anserisalpingitidis TaxID=519450 RepID=A0A8F2DF70_9MOLU|nr:hypothetical protein [Mycoplasma anserisalpingitidis]